MTKWSELFYYNEFVWLKDENAPSHVYLLRPVIIESNVFAVYIMQFLICVQKRSSHGLNTWTGWRRSTCRTQRYTINFEMQLKPLIVGVNLKFSSICMVVCCLSKAFSAQKKMTVVALILIRIFSLVFLYRLKQNLLSFLLQVKAMCKNLKMLKSSIMP